MEPVPQEPQNAAEPQRVTDSKVETSKQSRLRLAVRKARVEEAERSEVIADLRGAEIARLEMLQEELRPLLADVPAHIDMFDMGLMPGEKPRLFVDMIAFVEMGRDRRSYRFVQDTRHGRVLIVESERVEVLVEAVANYIARRLIEREKALAANMTDEPDRSRAAAREAILRSGAKLATETPARKPRFFVRSFGFIVDVLGSAALFALLAIGTWNVLAAVSAWLSTHHGH